jgi:hypothetical protein
MLCIDIISCIEHVYIFDYYCNINVKESVIIFKNSSLIEGFHVARWFRLFTIDHKPDITNVALKPCYPP